MEQLVALGADLTVVDPHVQPGQLPEHVELTTASPASDDDGADLVLYLVDHADFDRSAVPAMGRRILDCRHVLEGPNVVSL